MGPTIKQLDVEKNLLNPAMFNDEQYTKVNIKQIIFRPIMKRMVFVTLEFGRIALFEGDAYEVHKDDSDEALISALLTEIDNKFKS